MSHEHGILGCFTFSPALSGSLWLLKWRQQAVQEIQEAFQYTTVTKGSLANAGKEHEDPDMNIGVYWS